MGKPLSVLTVTFLGRIREKKFLTLLRKGKIPSVAAKTAGYSPKPRPVRVSGPQNVATKVDDLWMRYGLSDDEFIEKHLLPALNANETKFFAHNGRVVSKRTVIAWGPRI